MPASGTFMVETDYYESGYGKVTERIVISDTYSNLFATRNSYLATQTFVDVVSIGSSKKDLSIEEGSYASDELSIKLSQIKIRNVYDKTCYDMILSAMDETNKIYIAYFIQPDDTNTDSLIKSAEFIGIISTDFKAKEVSWQNRTEYDPDTQPIYSWDLKAKSFDFGSFQGDKLEEILTDIFADTTWRAANIADRMGYCDLGGGKVTKFCNLVNLNTLNTKIAATMASRMSAKLGETFTIVIDECTLDEKFSPARWYNTPSGEMFDGTIGWTATHNPSRYIGHNGLYYSILNADAQTIKLGDGISDDYSPFVSHQMFWWYDVNGGAAGDGSPQQARLNSVVEKQDITFADYMIGVGTNFGLYVRFYYISATELHVSFMSYMGFTKNECYIPDVTDSDLNTTAYQQSNGDKKVYGRACQWASEGYGKSYKFTQSMEAASFLGSTYVTKGYIESIEDKTETSGNKIIFTIAPTVRQQNCNDISDFTDDNKPGVAVAEKYFNMPHNAAQYHPSGVRRDTSDYPDSIWNSIGLHTAIYLKITGIESSSSETDPTKKWYINKGLNGVDIWSPAAAGHYKYNGVEEVVFGQADYLNFIRGTEEKVYKTEKNLTVPYLCRFRRSQNGSHADDDGGRGRWQNLTLGSKIKFGSISNVIWYVVTGIERDSEKKQTKIKLWNISHFAFSEASGLTSSTDIAGDINDFSPAVRTGLSEEYIASGAVNKYNIVALNIDGTYSKASPSEANVGKFAGIAMNTVSNGNRFSILRPGETFYNPDWNYDPHTPLYLRYLVTSEHNISADLLTTKNTNENVVLLIGYGTGATVETIDFTDINNQIILTL